MSATIRLRDSIWIWGHPENSCQSYVDPPVEMPVTPAQGARYLGARNVFYVAFGHPMDLKECSKDLQGISRAGLAVESWGVPAADRLEETFRYAPLFPNLDRMVFDDFMGEGEGRHQYTRKTITIAELEKARERMHAAGMEMWVVWYQSQLDYDVADYINVFDGVSFWFWNEPDADQYHKYMDIFLKKTEGKKRLVGCYLYNFGLRQQATAKLVRYQLDNNRLLMKQGDIEGFVLHNNNFGGLGYPAYEEAKLWMDEFGDDLIHR